MRGEQGPDLLGVRATVRKGAVADKKEYTKVTTDPRLTC